MQKRLFSELELSEPVLKAVERLGFELTSPIQSAAIPLLLTGKDVVGQSATGSGKTAAFAIPAIELISDATRHTTVLIMTPTRELAMQVAEEFSRLAFFRRGIYVTAIFGGASYDRQFSELRKGPQVVIGTPGRIIDHLQRNTLDLSQVKMVVLDECDRMLDMGFREDMERILSAVPKERQTVFFSATLPPAIRKLIDAFGNKPEHVHIAPQELSVPTIEQMYFEVQGREKLNTLTTLLQVERPRLSIIFCNTQAAVDDIADALAERGFSSDRLHGGLTQMQRTRTMARFKQGVFQYLVATDVAGRGIDVEDLDLVINFDLPYDPEDYVHRVGRTGRAGRKGRAISLVSPREFGRLREIGRYRKEDMRRCKVPTVSEVEEIRVSDLLKKTKENIATAILEPYVKLIARLTEGEDAISLEQAAAGVLMELMNAQGIAAPTGTGKPPSKKAEKAAKAAAAAPASEATAEKPAEPKPSHKKVIAETPDAKEAKETKEPQEVKEPVAKPVKVKAEKAAEPVQAELLPLIPASEVPAESSAKPVKPKAEKPTKVEKVEAKKTPAAEKKAPAIAAEAVSEEKDGPQPFNPDEDAEEGDISDDEYFSGGRSQAKGKTKGKTTPAVAPADDEDEGLDDADENEDEDAQDESEDTSHDKGINEGEAALPPPAKGYRWLSLNIGKDHDLKPRDIVDAIVEDGEYPAKSVGLIRLQNRESYVQVEANIAKDVADSLHGGEFEGRKLKVKVVHSGGRGRSTPDHEPARESKPAWGKSFPGKGPRKSFDGPPARKPYGSSSGPRNFDGPPPPRGGDRGGYGGERKSYGGDRSSSSAPRKSYGNDFQRGGDDDRRPPPRRDAEGGERRSYGDGPRGAGGTGDRKPYGRSFDGPPASRGPRNFDGPPPSRGKAYGSSRPSQTGYGRPPAKKGPRKF